MMTSAFVDDYKVGDQLDVFNKSKKNWYIATIKCIKKNFIVTQDIILNDKQSIKKSSKRLAALYTHTVNINVLQKSLLKYKSINHWMTNISSYYHAVYDPNSNSILTSMIAKKHHLIIKYDIKNDKFELLTTIPTIYDSIRTQTIDAGNNQFYVWLRCDNHEAVLSLNLDTLKYENSTFQTEINCYGSYVAIIIHNKCHLFDDKSHITFNDEIDETSWFQFDDTINTNSNVAYFNILYVESCRKLIKFCNCYDSPDEEPFGIFYADINDKNQQIFEWNEYHHDLELLNYYFVHAVIAFDHIIFIFALTEQCKQLIFALDVLYDKIFTDECIKQVSYIWYDTGCAALKSNENNIHIIDFGKYGTHYNYSLYHIIPNQMYKFYTKKYDPLIFGFVKQTQKDCKLSHNIPKHLSDVILSFFPLFL